jgi:hypothetical protein
MDRSVGRDRPQSKTATARLSPARSSSPIADPREADETVADPRPTARTGLNLRAGEWVEVRSIEEILETLDDRQCLDGLPFMPEMLQYCGKRFRVYKSAHKTCDTIETFAVRRMDNAVHLESLRCDGEAHGGCQAGCLLFWKDAWLRRVPGSGAEAITSDRSHAVRDPSIASCGIRALQDATREPAQNGEERYRCQATELRAATHEVRRRDRWDPRFYFRDLASGNVRIQDFVWYGLLAIFNAFTNRWLGRRVPHICGRAGQTTPTCEPKLRAGSVVQVRSKREIEDTLDANQRNRGLWFDVEMLPYSQQGTFKVLRRVERIINEKTGRMMRIPGACLILDNVTCSGHYSQFRMFCPRSIYPYWREIWLRDAAAEEGRPIQASDGASQ